MVKIGDIELPDFPLLLAPMEDVSDPPFRAVCKDNGADLMYTEFISSEGLIRHAYKSIQKLDIYDYERPVGIQIFGGEEDAMVQSAQIVEKANPTLIDINYKFRWRIYKKFQNKYYKHPIHSIFRHLYNFQQFFYCRYIGCCTGNESDVAGPKTETVGS